MKNYVLTIAAAALCGLFALNPAMGPAFAAGYELADPGDVPIDYEDQRAEQLAREAQIREDQNSRRGVFVDEDGNQTERYSNEIVEPESTTYDEPESTSYNEPESTTYDENDRDYEPEESVVLGATPAPETDYSDSDTTGWSE